MSNFLNLLREAAERIAERLIDDLRNDLPKYPDPELLGNLILVWVVKSFEKRAEKGIFPKKKLEDAIDEEFKTYKSLIIQSLFRLFREERIQDLVKFYKIVFLVGAGFTSEAGVPLTKFLMKFDFKEVSRDKSRAKKFKEIFKQEFLRRDVIKPTEAHRTVAEMFYYKIIIELICLNWDNLIEKSYEYESFGKIRKINREGQRPIDDDNDGYFHYLWKLHGDVEDQDYEWVYPGMDGRVFSSLLNYISALSERLLVFLIVGYSESEKEIVEKVIKPLENSPYIYNTFRIGLDMRLFDKHRENYIVAPSEWIIPIIFSEVRKMVSRK